MLISEEWERREQEALKPFEEEADKYHEHLEYEHRTIDRVAYEEEGTCSFKSGDEEEDVGGRVIMQTFDDNLEEEMFRQLKGDEEEAKRSPLRDRAAEDVELPIGELQEGVSSPC